MTSENSVDCHDAEPFAPLNLEARLRAVLAHLSPAESRVAALVGRDPGRAAQLTVTELAREASSSPATVVRAAKSLGFDGYPQLRYALAAHAGRAALAGQHEVPPVADIAETDGVPVILAKLAAYECSQLRATAELASAPAMEAIATAMAQARRCCVFGVGSSGLVAADLNQKITRIGLPGSVHTDLDAALVAASLLRPGDLALAISHGGESPGAHEPLRTARAAGAVTAAFTGMPRSTLARQADHVVLTAGTEHGPRSAAVGSRTSQLLLVDTLFARVAQLTPQSASALQKTHRAVAAVRRRGR